VGERESRGEETVIDSLRDAEAQALKIEAELISAFGTIESGGLLANAVIPTGLARRVAGKLIVPQGCIERAQLGLELLKVAVLELAKANPAGIKNSDAASIVGLRSDYRGKQKDYLSYSILGLPLREGRVSREPETHKHRANG
jgi:hypothetical protein